MTPEYVQMLFKRLSDEEAWLLGFDSVFSRPEWMICSVLPVAPPSVRPSVKKDGQQPRSEDDLTHKYIDIIKCNKTLKQKLHALADQNNSSASGLAGSSATDNTKQINSRLVESWRYILQYHVATLIDNECGVNKAQQRSGRPVKAIRQRLKSKEGRIRGNLMGKRVDFSARTVITPDPLLKLDELGVPLDMCTNMTFPEKVNPFNIDRLRRMVSNGTEKYPGARIIEKANGRRMSLKFFNSSNNHHLLIEKANALCVGDTVHRHILEGDPVLFNRQPSLHKMSMMCHRVKPMKVGKTFRLSVDATAPYNADFDGDEMNMHVPQSMEAATELKSLASVRWQIIGPAKAEPCLAPVQDTMLGAYLLSKEENAFTRRHMMNTLLWTSKTWQDIVDSGDEPVNEVVTGHETYNTILPNDLNIDTKVKLPGAPRLQIQRGKIKSGIINKGAFKEPSQGLIHVAFQDCGPTAARDLIDDTRGVVTAYMYQKGFSVGVSDLMIPENTKKEVNEIISEAHAKVEKDMQDLYSNKFENETCLDKASLVENIVSNNIRHVSGSVAERILSMSNSRFRHMVEAGSKGNNTNITQMIGCLGQQSIEDQRVTYSFENRTLPHFCKFDDSLEARGFVDNSYLTGLTPSEFFFHAMAGRVGLIDTAVKTAQTGYIQRRLVKSMEDIRCENDETVRNANGKIVHLVFGEDGMDSAKLERQHIPFTNKDHLVAELYLGKSPSPKDKEVFLAHFFSPTTAAEHQMLVDQKVLGKTAEWDADGENDAIDLMRGLPVVNYFRDIVCKSNYESNDHLQMPVQMNRALRNFFAKQQPTTKTSSYPSFHETFHMIQELVKTLSFCIDNVSGTSINPCVQLFNTLLSSHVLLVDTRRKFGSKANIRQFLDHVVKLYEDSKVHAGEMVGIIAAQSLGEPATQMTLNTFHFAGVSSKSKVTQSLPRLKEIITITKNPKASSLTMYLKAEYKTKKDAQRIKNIMEITTLRDITRATSIFYDPTLHRYGTMLDEDTQMLKYIESLNTTIAPESTKHNEHPNHWVVRIEIDREQLLSRELHMEDIYYAMKTLHGEDIEVEYSDDNADNLLVRVRVSKYADSADQMDDYFLLKMLETNLLDNVVLRGIANMHNISITEKVVNTVTEKGTDGKWQMGETKQMALESDGRKDGTSLLEALIHPAVDATRTLSDHLTEVFEVLGVEATRELIIREIENVIRSNSASPPSRRHIMLLADTMTSMGDYLISIDRNGIKRSDIGPLARCSFEESDKQLYQAAIFGEHDDVQGVSANIMLGQVAPCGTGMVRIAFDEDEFEHMQKNFAKLTGSAQSWEDHVATWERDNERMHEVQTALDNWALGEGAQSLSPQDFENYPTTGYGTGDAPKPTSDVTAPPCDTTLDFDYTDDMLNEGME